MKICEALIIYEALCLQEKQEQRRQAEQQALMHQQNSAGGAGPRGPAPIPPPPASALQPPPPRPDSAGLAAGAAPKPGQMAPASQLSTSGMEQPPRWGNNLDDTKLLMKKLSTSTVFQILEWLWF